MKLSNETLSVLKNFGAINQGIMFKKGKTLKTVSSQKNILAEVNIAEEIPADFGVYDINSFLSVVSLHKEDPSFDFDEKHVLIVGNKGRSKTKYRFCEPAMIVLPPEKQLTMPDSDISFDLSSEDFDWVMRSANVLSSPNIAVESDGQKVNIVTLDVQNDSAHTESLEIGNGNQSKYRMIFKTENLSKILPGSYEVVISKKLLSRFQSEDKNLTYYIALEPDSTYDE